jgi:hypothetical protein
MLTNFIDNFICVIPTIIDKGITTRDVTIAITVAGGALTTAIGVLWKTVLGLSKKQIDMSKELGKLEGKHDGIRDLSYRVLNTVNDAVRDSHRDDNRNN